MRGRTLHTYQDSQVEPAAGKPNTTASAASQIHPPPPARLHPTDFDIIYGQLSAPNSTRSSRSRRSETANTPPHVGSSRRYQAPPDNEPIETRGSPAYPASPFFSEKHHHSRRPPGTQSSSRNASRDLEKASDHERPSGPQSQHMTVYYTDPDDLEMEEDEDPRDHGLWILVSPSLHFLPACQHILINFLSLDLSLLPRPNPRHTFLLLCPHRHRAHSTLLSALHLHHQSFAAHKYSPLPRSSSKVSAKSNILLIAFTQPTPSLPALLFPFFFFELRNKTNRNQHPRPLLVPRRHDRRLGGRRLLVLRRHPRRPEHESGRCQQRIDRRRTRGRYDWCRRKRGQRYGRQRDRRGRE